MNILPLSGWQERKKKSLLFFSSERSAVWQWSNLLVMWLHSLLRWRWSFIDDSLWNLSSTAAEDSIYSSARLKYQAACPKWKMPPHIQTKTLQQWVSDGFLVYKYMYVYTFLWTLFKGINFFFFPFSSHQTNFSSMSNSNRWHPSVTTEWFWYTKPHRRLLYLNYCWITTWKQVAVLNVEGLRDDWPSRPLAPAVQDYTWTISVCQTTFFL